MQIQTTSDGQKYYPGLPEGWRRASLFDFYIIEHPIKINPPIFTVIMNKPYLLHSEMYPGRYYAMRTTADFTERNDFSFFLQKGRVYVQN